MHRAVIHTKHSDPAGVLDPANDLHHTAAHEAAHAVVAIKHGCVLHYVTIVPTAAELGACQWQDERDPATSAEVAKFTLAALRATCAGAFGELVFGVVPFDEVTLSGIGGDVQSLYYALRPRFRPKRIDEILDRAFKDTYEYVVTTPRVLDSIGRVALALLDRKTLNDAQVRAAGGLR